MFPFLQKDSKIRLTFKDDNLTWDDLETLEKIRNGENSPAGLKLMTAHCMVDEYGQPIPEDKALKILGKLKKKEIEEVITKFGEAIQESLVPNRNGSGSPLPSEVGSVMTLPVGPQR